MAVTDGEEEESFGVCGSGSTACMGSSLTIEMLVL